MTMKVMKIRLTNYNRVLWKLLLDKISQGIIFSTIKIKYLKIKTFNSSIREVNQINKVKNIDQTFSKIRMTGVLAQAYFYIQIY